MRPLVLVLRSLGIGDFATAVPALRALRRAYPDHEVVLAAPAPLQPLAAASGAVDRLFPTRPYVHQPVPAELGWGGRWPAVAVNLHGSGPQSHRALLGMRPGRLLAFACDAAGFERGPAWVPAEHEVTRWCRMLAWYGVAADPADLDLAGPPLPPELAALAGSVVVHPGASGPERCWPVSRYAALARALRGAGHRVLVTGSPAEEPPARELAEAAGLPEEDLLAGRTDLVTLAGLVASASAVICGDTGVAHLATAYRTPSVVLFGPVPPARWAPPADRPWHAVLWHGPDGLEQITVEEALDAARRVAAGGPAVPARRVAAGGPAVPAPPTSTRG